MKKYFRTLLIAWLVLSFIFMILAFINVRNSGESWELIIWGILWGAFIWEDLVVFALYNVVASIVVLLIKDNRYVLVFILFFWLIRSLGEVLYWFLQQFNQPAHYPHDQYDWQKDCWQKALFGDLSNQNYFRPMDC